MRLMSPADLMGAESQDLDVAVLVALLPLPPFVLLARGAEQCSAVPFHSRRSRPRRFLLTMRDLGALTLGAVVLGDIVILLSSLGYFAGLAQVTAAGASR